jgi:hypothetical protein
MVITNVARWPVVEASDVSVLFLCFALKMDECLFLSPLILALPPIAYTDVKHRFCGFHFHPSYTGSSCL